MGGGTDGVGWPWTVVVRFIPSKLGEVELAREAGHACVAVSYLPCRESKGGKGGVGSSWLSCIARLQAPVAPNERPNKFPILGLWDFTRSSPIQPGPLYDRPSFRRKRNHGSKSKTLSAPVLHSSFPLHALLFVCFFWSVISRRCRRRYFFRSKQPVAQRRTVSELEKGNNNVRSRRNRPIRVDTSTVIVEESSFLEEDKRAEIRSRENQDTDQFRRARWRTTRGRKCDETSPSRAARRLL